MNIPGRVVRCGGLHTKCLLPNPTMLGKSGTPPAMPAYSCPSPILQEGINTPQTSNLLTMMPTECGDSRSRSCGDVLYPAGKLNYACFRCLGCDYTPVAAPWNPCKRSE